MSLLRFLCTDLYLSLCNAICIGIKAITERLNDLVLGHV